MTQLDQARKGVLTPALKKAAAAEGTTPETLAGLVAGQLAWPNLVAWEWIIAGSFFGPFASYVLFYQGLRYIDLSKGAVIRASQPIFVALYSLALFGVFITAPQFVGGLLMVAGVGLMLWNSHVKRNV